MKVFLLLTLVAIIAFADDSRILKNFAQGSCQFTAGVYKKLSKKNSGSFMFGSLSLNILLALIHVGAKGRTAQEISTGLHLPDGRTKINEIYSKLSSQLKSTKDYNLTSANKVYLNKGFKIIEQFRATAVNIFDAEIQVLNFADVNKSAKQMNLWVEKKTQNKIKDLVSPDDLEESVAVLINAMYFRGKWVKQFSLKATRLRTFHIRTQNQKQVKMMEMADTFNSYVSHELNAKFLEMPYEGEDISMTFVLPNDVEGLSKLEERIADVLVAPAYKYGRVHVVIPKFKLKTRIEFKPILQAMGIRAPFSMNADFTGFAANMHLHISKIIQKTFIEVEEKGTTAAAATAAFFVYISALYRPPPVLQFIADHPFIYYIKIKGVVVFLGRYTGP